MKMSHRAGLLNGSLKGTDPHDPAPTKEPKIPSLIGDEGEGTTRLCP